MLRIKWSRNRILVIYNVSDLDGRLVVFHLFLTLRIVLKVIRLPKTHSCGGHLHWLSIMIGLLTHNFLSQILVPSLKNFDLVFRVVWKYSGGRESTIISFSEGIIPDLRRNIHFMVKCSDSNGFLFQFSLVVDVALVYNTSPLRHGLLELQLITRLHSLESSRACSSETWLLRSRVFYLQIVGFAITKLACSPGLLF